MSEFKTLREKIAAESAARKERYAKFEAVYEKAYEAGMTAGKAALPTPMVVSEAAGLSDLPKPGGKSYYVPEGACGFAWVTVKPGNSSFAKWLKKTSKSRGGSEYTIWIGEHGQSIERKEAHARAMAKVLREELGIKAYSGSRLD